MSFYTSSFVNTFLLFTEISPNKHLLEASAFTRSFVVHNLNFFEQTHAGWGPRYAWLSDCGFYF